MSETSGQRKAALRMPAAEAAQEGLRPPIDPAKIILLDNVVGHPESIRQQVSDLLDMYQNPGEYERDGIAIPRLVVISGESGVGKTLLVEAFVGELQTRGLLGGYKKFEVGGVTGSNVGDTQANARTWVKELRQFGKKMQTRSEVLSQANPGSIQWGVAYFDEVDAALPQRGIQGQVADQSQGTAIIFNGIRDALGLNPGTDALPLIVFMSTNYISSVDQALLRDALQIKIPRPDDTQKLETLLYFIDQKLQKGSTLFDDSVTTQVNRFRELSELLARGQEGTGRYRAYVKEHADLGKQLARLFRPAVEEMEYFVQADVKNVLDQLTAKVKRSQRQNSQARITISSLSQAVMDYAATNERIARLRAQEEASPAIDVRRGRAA